MILLTRNDGLAAVRGILNSILIAAPFWLLAIIALVMLS